MKGEREIIERLNEALFLELGAVNQYWLHYRLLEDWGYTKLAKKERAESIEEMHHADKIIARIVFLEGHPNLQSVAPLRIGQNVKEVLESDLAGEYDARTSYKRSREICHELGDYVTMAGKVGTAGHIHIGSRSIVSGNSMVAKDLPEGSFVSGYLARPHRQWMECQAALNRLPGLLKRLSKKG